ncbi:MAG: GNAT family N-acetyltransferase [Anaerolineales bacterium]|nr:GNAT family N-acetyltransferase [Anaerolineales bacterium]
MECYPRAYQDARDLEKMRQLLAAGKKADNGSYYVHPGDLDWWLHYLSQEDRRDQTIFLWENSQEELLLGWTLLSPEWHAVDVFIHPRLRGSLETHCMFEWAVNRMIALESKQHIQKIRTMWIDENDVAVIAILENLGFQRDDFVMNYLENGLSNIDDTDMYIPEGCTIRAISGEEEADKHAAASYAAFESEKPFEQYVKRYRSFMRSPVYHSERDLVIVAPDGGFAGFCMIWLDHENQVGLFEPVGIHPQYQKRGLGKALLRKGLERMKAYGMQKAMVCVEHTNSAAIALYQKVGFIPVKNLRTYTKRVDFQHSD